jgi:hypothetical protein
VGFRQRILERSRKALLNPAVMRWVSDDRVMRATEGLLDARGRLEAAWKVLKNGHALPNIDPALDEDVGERPVEARRAEAEKPRTNGASAAAPPTAKGSDDMDESLKERNTLASIGGKDVFEKARKFMAADNARKMGIYPFFRPLDLNDGPEAVINGRRVIMLGSNN